MAPVLADPNSDDSLERKPAQDAYAEQSVLGSMLLSKEAIADVVSELRGSDFAQFRHETIYETMLEINGRGEAVDAVTLAGELARGGNLEKIGGAAYIHTLVATPPTPANASYYARIVRELATLRALVNAGTKIVQLGLTQDGSDVEEIVNLAQMEIHRATERRTSQDYHLARDLWEDTIHEIEIAGSGPEGSGLLTGFTGLDELTRGFHPGQMIIVAARPAMGKSTIAMDFCRSAAIGQGKSAVIFSLEMSRGEIMKRIIAAEAQVPLNVLISGDVREDNWNRISIAAGKINDAPLRIDDSPNLHMSEIRSKCRRLKEREDLQLVVVDYLQLMSSTKRVESRQQEVSDISRSLKLLAKELEIPVVAVAQLNRGPEQRDKRIPMMSDLRESGSLEQDADMILLLHRPDVYNHDDRPGEADIIVAKHRNGRTDTIAVTFQGNFARFANLAQSQVSNPGSF